MQCQSTEGLQCFSYDLSNGISRIEAEKLAQCFKERIRGCELYILFCFEAAGTESCSLHLHDFMDAVIQALLSEAPKRSRVYIALRGDNKAEFVLNNFKNLRLDLRFNKKACYPIYKFIDLSEEPDNGFFLYGQLQELLKVKIRNEKAKLERSASVQQIVYQSFLVAILTMGASHFVVLWLDGLHVPIWLIILVGFVAMFLCPTMLYLAFRKLNRCILFVNQTELELKDLIHLDSKALT